VLAASFLLVQFLVGDKALQSRVHSQAEDVHDQLTNQVTQAQVQEDEHPHGTNFIPNNDLREEVSDDGRANRDEDNTDDSDDEANAAERTQTAGVSEDEAERVPRGRTEVLTQQRNLNIGVLVQELDEALEAGNDVLQQLEDLDQIRVLGLFRLLLEVVHPPLDELDHSQDEGTEGEGTFLGFLGTGASTAGGCLVSALVGVFSH